MALPLASVPTPVVWLLVGAGVISLIAYAAFILPPAIAAYSRTWEKATAAALSLLVLAALVLVGFVLGVFIFYHWDTISGWIH
jgi:sterol desaturase/sphingolipid hydroxylase (fatty acid hydroxylase superfamily)